MAAHGPGGILALVAKALQEAEADVLLLTAPNVPTANNSGSNGAALGLANSSLVENTTAIMVDGIVSALAEVTPPSSIPADAGRIALNELATPWSQPRRQWAVLTNQATHLVGRQRPIDTLYAILEAGGMSGDITRDDAKAFYNECVCRLFTRLDLLAYSCTRHLGMAATSSARRCSQSRRPGRLASTSRTRPRCTSAKRARAPPRTTRTSLVVSLLCH